MHNFHEGIARAARAFPERIAVEWVGSSTVETTTYAALIETSAEVSSWLADAGVRRGDRVALLAANDARWVTTYLGVLHLGAVVVPLDTAYSTDQVRTILVDSGALIVFAAERYLDTARDAAAGIPDRQPRVVSLATAAATRPSSDRAGVSTQLTSADVALDETAVILYTSGTTADPKGVVLTHGNLNAERDAVLSVVSASHDDVVLGVLPLFHALAEMANLWLPLSIGARVVFLDTVNSTTLLDALQTRGITILACVPQFFYLIHQRVVGEVGRRGALARRALRILLAINRLTRDHAGINLGRHVFARVHQALGPKMRLLITGGSRFDPDIARDLYGLGVSLYNGYGLTETSGAATIVRAGDRFNTSVGQPVPGVDVRIAASETGEDDGEILIRGPIVMREYYQRPDATAAVMTDGWLRTGDLGRIDRDGRVHITGRLKEIIVLSSGKNLYPEEIEAHYRKSIFIKELCVLGLGRPDEPAAERLHAVVVPDDSALREKGIVNVRELIRFELEGLAVQLPPHKRILTFDVAREPLARTSTGKLKRNDILRNAREREAAPDHVRALSDGERAWLAHGDHAESLAVVAALLQQAVLPDSNLELDLGLDSMERVELVARLEARRHTRVPPEIRATILTARELIEAVDAAPETLPGPSVSGLANTDSDLPWDKVLAELPDPALAHELRRSKFLRSFLIYWVLRGCVLLLTPVLGLRVTGRTNIPARGPFIVAPNHQTFLDGFLVAAALPYRAFREIYFVGAAELFETRFMAWGARAINIVPLDPDANLVGAMQAAATGLRLRKVLMLFPEGERTIDGTMKPFRKGAAILASHLDVPIVPVGLDGLFPLWPRGRAFQWRMLLGRRTHATIAFGAPLTVARGEYEAGTQALTAGVARTMNFLS